MDCLEDEEELGERRVRVGECGRTYVEYYGKEPNATETACIRNARMAIVGRRIYISKLSITESLIFMSSY